MTVLRHLRRALTLDVILMSLALCAAATYGALPTHVPFYGFVDMGLWV